MSMLRIHDGADSDTANLTLYVWATPNGTGNLHGGLYAYRYSQRTLCIKAGGAISVALDDQTTLKLSLSGLLTTRPDIVTPLPPKEPGALVSIQVANMPTQGLLVFYSIALRSNNQADPQQAVYLYCDPQVGNDPKVAP